MNTPYQLDVDNDHAGARLDKFLAAQLPDISRARLQGLIEEGAVSRAGKPFSNSSYKVKTGESYTLTVPEVKALDLTPANIKLDVIYEDADILILNKPVGMTVHPAAGTKEDTLVHALLGHCGDSLSGIGGVARPGIVHRIDKETSGLLAIAKNDAAHQHLSAQLKDHSMARSYVAFCWGAPNPHAGTVDAPLARNPRQRKQMAVVEGGRHAITHYTTETVYRAPGAITPLASKITCNLETGRTHQIRVHMAHAKCPLIGDPVYGPGTKTKLNRLASSGTRMPEELIATLNLLHRQALHAYKLELTHPKTEELMTFLCPLPVDLTTLENALDTLTKQG